MKHPPRGLWMVVALVIATWATAAPGLAKPDGGPGPRAAGHFDDTGGLVQGRHVSFGLSDDACMVTDFRVFDALFFSSIEMPGPCTVNDRSDRGRAAQIRLRSEQGQIRLHDAPNGLIRFEADEGPLVLRIAPAVTTVPFNGGLDLLSGNLTGRFYLTGPAAGDSYQFDQGLLTLHGSDANFLVSPPDPAASRSAVHEAIEDGRVGGEIDVLIGPEGVSEEVLTYDDVFIGVSRRDEARYRIYLEANLTEGRVFVFNLAPEAFRPSGVGVRYYDVAQDGVAEPVPITESNSLDDILLLRDGEGPEYWFVNDKAGKHVLVAVPHWSPHLIELQGMDTEMVPIIVFGVLFGALFVGVAAVGMFRPRSR